LGEGRVFTQVPNWISGNIRVVYRNAKRAEPEKSKEKKLQ
jgi:hypothetical protein